MFFILLVTFLAGVVGSWLLFHLNVENPVLRYPLVVLFSYGIFFLCIRLWIEFIKNRKETRCDLDAPDPSGLYDSSTQSCHDNVSVEGGGGEFGGGGASGSYGESAPSIAEPASAPDVAPSVEVGGDAIGAGEAAAGAVSEGGIVLIPIAVVLALVGTLILGSSIYLIYEAPAILSEALFEGVLAVSLIRRVRQLEEGDWVVGVFRATWIPFLVTLAVAIAGALLLVALVPDAVKLSDIWED